MTLRSLKKDLPAGNGTHIAPTTRPMVSRTKPAHMSCAVTRSSFPRGGRIESMARSLLCFKSRSWVRNMAPEMEAMPKAPYARMIEAA